MSLELTTEEDLAADWKLSLDKIIDLRTRHKWPHVKLGRFEVRYTDEQIAAIVAANSIDTTPKPSSELAGLPQPTRRSSAAKRKAS